MQEKLTAGGELIVKLTCLRVFEMMGHRPSSVKLSTFLELRDRATGFGATDQEIYTSVARGMLRYILRGESDKEKARRTVETLPMREQFGVENKHFDSARRELEETARTYYQPVPHF